MKLKQLFSCLLSCLIVFVLLPGTAWAADGSDSAMVAKVGDMEFSSLADAVGKETGVTGTEKKVWTRGRLQTFCNSYTEQFRREDGNVTLTYHPIYIVTRRKKIKIYK